MPSQAHPRRAGRRGALLRRLLPAAVLLAVLAGCERDAAPAAADVQQGGALFARHCASCHGEAAVGQEPLNPFGSADPDAGFVAPALNGQGHCADHDPQKLLGYIREGTGVPGSPMLGFGDELSEREMVQIIAYLESLWPRVVRRIYKARHDEARARLYRQL